MEYQEQLRQWEIAQLTTEQAERVSTHPVAKDATYTYCN